MFYELFRVRALSAWRYNTTGILLVKLTDYTILTSGWGVWWRRISRWPPSLWTRCCRSGRSGDLNSTVCQRVNNIYNHCWLETDIFTPYFTLTDNLIYIFCAAHRGLIAGPWIGCFVVYNSYCTCCYFLNPTNCIL